ncbi:hypothetical protein ACIOC2_37040 [Streptomyces sp. NPDC088337]|uniref:hypothetical protein n=1 Tax=unclassified Streptomyces TaxID=2593676 RepID=UPI00382C1FE3
MGEVGRRFQRLAGSVVVVGATMAMCSTFSGGVANAAETDPELAALSGVGASQVTVLSADAVCEDIRSQTGEEGDCQQETEMGTGGQQTASVSLLAEYGDLVSQDGVKLSEASAAATVWTRTWWQQKRGLYYYNWKERHEGRIFYDGTTVWSTTSRSGYKGWHKCGLGSGIGYSIEVKDCSTERRYDLKNEPISEWDRFRVHVVWKGMPIYATHKMHANAYPSGKLTFH